MNILNLSLHSIDVKENHLEERAIEKSDASNYIKGLAEKLINSNATKQFESTPTSSVTNMILECCECIDKAALTSQTNETLNITNKLDCVFTTNCNLISKLFFEAQISAQQKYAFTEIKSGGLVQALVEYDAGYMYLISFVDHSEFIDELDLVEKLGLPKANETLKSACYYFNTNSVLTKILLTDTRTKFTDYWYDAFLSLIETRNDSTNTENAYSHFKNVLNRRLSKTYKADYLNLTNTLDVYFCQSENFNFEKCIDFVFENYKPIDNRVKIENIKSSVIELRTKVDNFDSVFDIDISPIINKIKNKKYKLTDNIELKVKFPEENLKNYIYSTTLDTDEKVLVIKDIDENIYKLFCK